MAHGFAPPSVDLTAALALARASGVPGAVAAPLLTAAAEGVRAGLADRKDNEA